MSTEIFALNGKRMGAVVKRLGGTARSYKEQFTEGNSTHRQNV